MRILILSFLGLLAACAAEAPSGGFKPANTAAYNAAAGAKYEMTSIVGIGDIVITDTALITSDGQTLPIKTFGDGVYAFENPPSELTNGENFCFSKPVTFFTWHRHDEGGWVMNVGDWTSPPSRPASNQWQAAGACGGSVYKAAG